MSADNENKAKEDLKDLKGKIAIEDDNSQDTSSHPKGLKREAVSGTEDEDWSPSRDDEDMEENEAKPRKAQTKKKKRYQQRYSAKFENCPMFRGWVKASSKGNYYAYCIPCGTHIKIASGKTDLKRHSMMRKHKMNMEASCKGQNCITAYILGQDQPIATVELPLPGKDLKGPPKRKYLRYSQLLEEDPQFADWVAASPKGEYFAHCIPCDTELSISGGKADLKRHTKNKKHIVAVAEFDKQQSVFKSGDQSITTFMQGQDYSIASANLPVNAVQISASMREIEDIQRSPIRLEVNPVSRTVAKLSDKDPCSLSPNINDAELQIAAFIAEHDLPDGTSDHLIQLLKNVCPDSSIGQNLESKGTDTALLLNNTLRREGFNELISLLKENEFSLIVDEAPGQGLERHLSMVVRVLHNFTITEAFLCLIPMTDVTPLALHTTVTDFFYKNGIPYEENLLGIAADGGNTKLGGEHSLSSLLKKDVPHLFVMKCISHSFSLCASAACLKLPHFLEDLARDVYSYFHYINNHSALEEFQAFIQVKPHKLLHPAQTRWLSMHSVVSKLLVKYDSLKSYFTGAVLVDKLEAPETILQRLSTPVTKLYLMFLDFILPFFDNLDKQMQSESSQIHVIHNAVGVTLKAIFECYLEDSYIKATPLKAIDYTDETKFKPLEEMYLGIKVQLEVTSSAHLQHEDLKNFQMNCLEFLIEGVTQIYRRFPYGSPVFESLENLNPKIVIEKNVPSLINLIYHFEHLATPDIQVVDSEWRLLRNMLDTLPLKSRMRPEVFWDTVSKATQVDNVPLCPNLSEFMLRLLCLPSCTAAVERMFSTINKTKRKSRNIPTETLMALMYSKQLVTSKLSLS